MAGIRARCSNAGESMFSLLVEAAATERAITTSAFGDVEDRISYAELLDGALRCAGALAARGIKPGDRVVCIMTTTRETIEAFFGIHALGAIPAPAAPPYVFASRESACDLVGHIVRATGARLLLTDVGSAPTFVDLTERCQGLEAVVSFPELKGHAPIDAHPSLGDDVAYVQSTSGSVSMPKPVVLYNRNVLANVRSIIERMELTESDTVVSWLPLFHDMGFIGGLLTGLVAKFDTVLLPPEKFVMEPISWWRAVSKHRGTVTIAPCFGFGLSARRVKPADLAAIDLSSLRVALIGSDPIDVQLLERFTQLFAPTGFDPRAFMPAYGLAESCLAVTLASPSKGIQIDNVDLTSLSRSEARSVEPAAVGSRAFVSCGRPIADMQVRIVSPSREPLAERMVGEVCVRGPSLMAGYWNAVEATAEVLIDGWLHTGDLGYLFEGNLFIVGRLKDMLIVRGRNYYAEDVERVVEGMTDVRTGSVVAFGALGEGGNPGTELLYVVAETNLESPERLATLSEEIAVHVSEKIGIRPAEVRLVKPKTLPKTTSGKKQRSKVREHILGKARTDGALPRTD